AHLRAGVADGVARQRRDPAAIGAEVGRYRLRIRGDHVHVFEVDAQLLGTDLGGCSGGGAGAHLGGTDHQRHRTVLVDLHSGRAEVGIDVGVELAAREVDSAGYAHAATWLGVGPLLAPADRLGGLLQTLDDSAAGKGRAGDRLVTRTR